MTRPCAFCGDPTERVYSVDMDLPRRAVVLVPVPAPLVRPRDAETHPGESARMTAPPATPSGLGKPWPHYPPR